MNDRVMLEHVVKQGYRFRDTPIVDDDFPAIRDTFDETLRVAAAHLEKRRPVVVCLCGSTRFWKEFQEANLRETRAGKIVLTVAAYPNIQKSGMIEDGCMGEHKVIVETVCGLVQCSKEEKEALDELHKRKIELADEVLILNVNGYIGESTRSELEHARRLDKTIRFLVPVAEKDERIA